MGKDEDGSRELERPLEHARLAWPGIEIGAASFREYVAERADGDLHAALASLRLDDLYLCCACAEGNDAAIVAFGNRFRPAIVHSVSKVTARAQVDDVVQQVMTKLFVAVADKPPAICSFLGKGKLSTWLQVVARREASNVARAERSSQPETTSSQLDMLYAHAMADDSDAMPQLKQQYRARFKEAFREALDELAPRERNLLRYECVDGLTTDQIAAIYCVSPSTIARWRASCRTRLHRTTRQRFSEEVGIEASEFGTVMRLIESQLNVSLMRLLRKPGD